jgi:hypothetical protein
VIAPIFKKMGIADQWGNILRGKELFANEMLYKDA